MTEGFEVKQNGDVFEVRCHKCGARWRNDQGEWLARVLEHAVRHFKKPRDTTVPPDAEPATKA